MDFAGLDRQGQGLFVHMGEHQDLAGPGRGHDDRQEPVRVECRSEDVAFLQHGLVVDFRKTSGLSHRNIFLLRRCPAFTSERGSPPIA